MNVLVAYASRQGATRGIAERIAQRLGVAGHHVDLRAVTDRIDVSGYEAIVIGSAVYLGRWQKEALAFVLQNQSIIAARPAWIFSSGPLGSELLDAKGRNKLEAAVPDDIPELAEAIRPRDHRVFFGALNPDDLPLVPRLMRILPAGRKLLEEGDFRDWTEIEAWADSIGAALTPEPVLAGATE
jgi:menaquinone-dependent protoporphyrinogen oxidase